MLLGLPMARGANEPPWGFIVTILRAGSASPGAAGLGTSMRFAAYAAGTRPIARTAQIVVFWIAFMSPPRGRRMCAESVAMAVLRAFLGGRPDHLFPGRTTPLCMVCLRVLPGAL